MMMIKDHVEMIMMIVMIASTFRLDAAISLE